MPGALDVGVVRDFGTALLIGVLIGIEREKRKAGEVGHAIGGLRTFTLIALLGASAGWLSRLLATPWLVAAGLVAVAALLVTGYVVAARATPEALGLTTEVAGVVVYLLGGLTTLGHRDLAVVLAVVTAGVLAYKQPLHGLVERLGWDDIFAGVRLLVATFIVLPLLPDRAVDPVGALNPHALWLLVLLISGLSLVGYVATRSLGAHRGTALTGLTGGLVSSTAVTLSFARESREAGKAASAYAFASGILLAWGVMFGRVLAEVMVVNPSIVAGLAVPFLLMAAAAASLAWLFFRRGMPARAESAALAEVPLRNPFSLRESAKFAAFFAAVLVLVKLVETHLPGEGMYAVAAVAGLTDVDAITLSMARYAREGDPDIAAGAIVVATLTNTVVKAATAAVLGAPALRRPVLVAAAAILATGLGGLLLR